MFQLLELCPMRLPMDGPRRDSVWSAAAHPPGFDQKYDFRTLVYDAVDLDGHVVLVCPKLLNLRGMFLSGRFTDLSGRGLRVHRLRRYRRHDEVILRAPGPVERLRWQGGAGLDLTMPVSRRETAMDGLRVVSTKSRENDLQWIADWAAHYVQRQGAQAIVLFENGSNSYSAQDVLTVLSGVKGLRAATVVATPLPFGPLGICAPVGLALFLQCGLLNITRHRFVSRARSHLHCDVDELAVQDLGAPTLFEAAERSFWGYATARCVWRYASGPGPHRHAAHVWRAEPETGTKEKWAVVPSGRLRGAAWDCHGVGRYALNAVCMRRDVRFLHCAQINTRWKGGCRLPAPEGMVHEGWLREGATNS